jgi:ABC-type cobalamin transport system permease subunit
MKKTVKTILSSATVAILSFPVSAFAQYAQPAGTGLPSNSIFKIIQSIMNWLLALVGIFGVIGFAIAGILYLTAAGDEDRINTAKKAMMYAIIGVIVALVGLVALKAAESMLGANSSF